MQVQATYKRSQDSLKLLERLDSMEEFRGANVRIVFNNRSAEDQKLLRYLSTSAGNSRFRLSPEMLKTAGFAALFGLGSIAYGLSGLLGYI